MKLETAKLYRDILDKAIAAAEASGSDEAQLVQHAVKLDDDAREELDEAIFGNSK
jgi:hypothetical protein